MDLLRFSTAGSVDDGKSTLIGRLLFDSRSVLDDQLAEVQRASRGAAPDLALLTDGLRAEREQGITIDVAYRYFATARRKFIIADTPGHEQYTRNMATGASTADATVILVDATRGIGIQSRRHAHIAHLLGIPHLILAVNKMDQAGYAQQVFDAIRAEFAAFIDRLGGARSVQAIPISALHGDNVVHRSAAMPWYRGPALLEFLEDLPANDDPLSDLRLPVQLALRPDHRFRGLAGQIAAGSVHRGMEVTVLPSGRVARVQQIQVAGRPAERARAPQSVTLVLDEELDAARGDMVVARSGPPALCRRFEADMVWFDEQPLLPGRSYLIKHTTRTVRATLALRHRIDVNTLVRSPAGGLAVNDIGLVEVNTLQPLMLDPYATSRRTGAFIVIDPESDRTVAAGMVLESKEGLVRETAEQAATGLWLVGGDKALRAAVVQGLVETLGALGRVGLVLTDEDVGGINADLGDGLPERLEATRRVFVVVRLLGRAGVTTIVTAERLARDASPHGILRRVELDGVSAAEEALAPLRRELGG